MQTSSDLSPVQSRWRCFGQRHDPMVLRISGRNACGTKIEWALERRVFLSNRWESIGGISRSYTQRFQEMLCIQACCHKLRSFVDHH
jgi:hypothetical protein